MSLVSTQLALAAVAGVEDTPIGRMPQFGAQHLGVLTVIVLACAVLVPLARRATATAQGRVRADRVMAVLGWLLLVGSIASTLYYGVTEAAGWSEALPFHVSDWLRFVLAFALITRSGWATSVSIFWGLTLNLQSVLTPDLRYYESPVLEFLRYWGFHSFALVAAVVLVWGIGMRPTWRGYAVSFAFTLLWAACAGVVNAVTGANYGYLAHAPAGRSLLDALGPWPVYVLWEIALVAGIWALMTWGFTAGGRDREIARSAVVRRVGQRVRP